MSWWNSLNAVQTFNWWMQLAAIVFGICTVITTALIWISGNRVSVLLGNRESLRIEEARKKLEDVERRQRKRQLSPDQVTLFIKTLSTLPSQTIDLGFATSGEDSFEFAQQLAWVFKKAGWTVRNENGVTQYLDVQFDWIGLFEPDAVRHDPSNSNVVYPGASLALRTVEEAFFLVDMDARFTRWPNKVPEVLEVVVGKKPDPTRPIIKIG